MRKMILVAALMVCGVASAQDATGTGQATSGSQSGATAGNTNIFEGSHQRGSVATTPPVYTPPAMFGGANNCGASDTFGVSVTGFGIGGARGGESKGCNAREDTGIAYKLGMQDVAKLRFFCFGSDENRLAYEAAGNLCPEGSTAKSLAQARLDQQARTPYSP